MRIYRILRGFGRQMSRANVNAYAASTAFFLFLSLIPMLMLICSILPYTPIKKSDIITAVTLLPQTLSPLLTSLIQSIYDSTFGVMSIAAIVTVWSAGKGVLALMRGLNAMNGVVEDRNYVLQRIIASFLSDHLSDNDYIFADSNGIREFIRGYDSAACPPDGRSVCPAAAFQGAVFMVYDDAYFAVMYTYIPNCKLKFSHQIPGAVFSATTWNIFSWGFSMYIQQFNGFDMYGSLTTIVIVMLWLYFCFYLFLIGAHINRFLTPFRRILEKERR